MSYRYRRIDVRKGSLFWQARPVLVDVPDEDGQAYGGLDLVPHASGEKWWRGLTRQHAIARAYRWAKRRNRREDRAGVVESNRVPDLRGRAMSHVRRWLRFRHCWLKGRRHARVYIFCADCTTTGGDYLFSTYYGDEDDA